jgi:hypothetical protein
MRIFFIMLTCLILLGTCAASQAQTPNLITSRDCPTTQGPVGGTDPVIGTYVCEMPAGSLSGNRVLAGLTFRSTGGTVTVGFTDEHGDSFTNVVDTTLSADSQRVITFCGSPTLGSHTYTVTFTGAGSAQFVQTMIAEYNNVTSCTPSGTASNTGTSSTTMTAGALPTLPSGDLLFNYVAAASAPQIGSWTAGSQANITWAKGRSDTMNAQVFQWGQYNATAGFTPSMTSSTSVDYVSEVVALPTGTTGTARSTNSILVAGAQSVDTNATNTSSALQFDMPTVGNLIVLMDSEANTGAISGITSSPSLTWHQVCTSTNAPQYSSPWYAINTSPSQNMTVTVSYLGTGNSRSFQVYDVVNASATPLDTGFGTSGCATAQGNQTSSGSLTVFTATPTAANELVVIVNSLDHNSGTAWTSPSGVDFMQANWGPNYGVPTTTDENDPWAIYYVPNNSAETWTMTQDSSQSAGVNLWAASAVAFTTVSGGGGSGMAQPGSAGWYPLGSGAIQGSVCPANNFGGYGYNFAQYCNSDATGNVHAWGSGMFDVKRNRLIFWGGGHNDYYGNEVYGLEFPAGNMVRYNPPSPPNGPFSGGQAPGSSTCVDTLSDGRPNSRHIYAEIVYLAAHDRMWIYGGSAACQTGGPVSDTWTLDLSTVTSACQPNCSASWQRMDNTYSTSAPCPASLQNPSNSDLNFGDDSAAYDSASDMVYHQDGGGTLRKYDFSHNCWTILNNSTFPQFGQGTNEQVDPTTNTVWFIGGDRNNNPVIGYVLLSDNTYAFHNVTSAATGCSGFLGTFIWPGFAFNSRLGQLAAWVNTSGATNTVYTINDSTLSAPICTANTFSGGPPYVGDPNANPPLSTPLTRGVLGRFAYNPVNDIYTTVNDATTQAFAFRLNSYTAADVDFSKRCFVADAKLYGGQRRCWAFDSTSYFAGPGAQGQVAGGHVQNHTSQGFPSPTLDNSTFVSGGGALKFVQGPTGFDSSGGSFALNACGQTNGPDVLKSSLCTQPITTPGDSIYIQWRQYMDSNTLTTSITTSDSTTQGQKQIILADADVIGGSCANGVLSNGTCVANACSDDEQVLQNVSRRNIPGNYFMCGSPVGGYDNYNTFVNGVGTVLQNGTGNQQTCLYTGGPPSTYLPANCTLYVAGEWDTYQIHIQLGTGGYWNGTGGTDALTSCPAGFKNSTIDMWVARPGLTSVKVQHYGPDTGNGWCFYNPSGYPMGKVWFLDYLTNFTSSGAAMTSWVDEAIISTTQIADPGFAGPMLPLVSLSPTSVPFGNQPVNTTSGAQTVTLTNPGTAVLTITSITLTGTNAASFSTLNSTCGSSLGVNSSCTIQVTFSPTVAQAYSASLTYTTNASSSPDNVPITGTGTPPVATPTFNPSAGTYSSAQSVVISTVTGGATICYTTDGSTPTDNGLGTCTHGTTYSGPVSVSSNQTLKAIGSENGFADSGVSIAPYIISPSGPSVVFGAGVTVMLQGTTVVN